MRPGVMGGIRQILRDHRRIALACALMALALRALLPAGLMLAPAGHTLTVAICADATGLKLVRDIVVPGAPAKAHDAKADPAASACPYAALAMASLGGADPILLAAALALLMVLGLAAIIPVRTPPASRLRPPLRAPPVTA